MPNDIVALAQQYAQQRVQAAVRRATIPVAFGLVAAVLFFFVAVALFVALFFWTASLYGPISAALIVAAVALVLGLLALAPLVVRRHPRPAPVQSSTTPQVVSLLAQTAPLVLKRPLLTVVLLGVAVAITARGSSADKK
jgi:hypothetical protein